jgi:hypothetical protein
MAKKIDSSAFAVIPTTAAPKSLEIAAAEY